MSWATAKSSRWTGADFEQFHPNSSKLVCVSFDRRIRSLYRKEIFKYANFTFFAQLVHLIDLLLVYLFGKFFLDYTEKSRFANAKLDRIWTLLCQILSLQKHTVKIHLWTILPFKVQALMVFNLSWAVQTHFWRGLMAAFGLLDKEIGDCCVEFQEILWAFSTLLEGNCLAYTLLSLLHFFALFGVFIGC